MEEPKDSRFKLWFKRVGVAGLIFFTVKGLIWLVIIFCAGKCVAN